MDVKWFEGEMLYLGLSKSLAGVHVKTAGEISARAQVDFVGNRVL